MSNKPIYILWFFIIFFSIQIFPGENSNPDIKTLNPCIEPAQTVLRRACYNCHSNETIWPWFSYLAPVSWMIIHEVNKAREHLNFSVWSDYSKEERKELMEKVRKVLKYYEMPPTLYVWDHQVAKLSAKDKEAVTDWIDQEDMELYYFPAIPPRYYKNLIHPDSLRMY